MTDLSDTRLDLPERMRDPHLLSLLQTLAETGITGRFVGGCVRDALIHRPVNDIDIAVNRPPDAVSRVLTDAGLRAIPTGIEHGTLTVLLESGPVEVTSLRRDVETDGRRAVVAFTEDWEEDAQRRDFTMNALYADAGGQVFDYHDGLADLAVRHIRFIGDAETRIREDVLRILRFFRFHAQLGILDLDVAGLAACAGCKDLLPTLSAERVALELHKILQSPDPAPVLDVMQAGGFLTHWLPELGDPEPLERLGTSDGLLRLALLIQPDSGADSRADSGAEIADRLRFSNRDRARLSAALQPVDAPASDAAARAMIYRGGEEAARDQAHLGLAQGVPDWARLLGLIGRWEAPRFPLGGADAQAAGFTPGPALGEALKTVEAAWVASDFTLAPDALRAMLRELREEDTA